jgi:spore germination cell wall hydrolase CwlJ-like protein
MLLAAILCIAEAVYFEARNQPPEGRLAVSYVIMNRVKESRYHDTPCDVVHAPKHFEYYWDGKKEVFNNKEAYGIAVITALVTYFELVPDPTHGATHYHEKNSNPWWSKGHLPVADIHDHRFYNTIP